MEQTQIVLEVTKAVQALGYTDNEQVEKIVTEKVDEIKTLIDEKSNKLETIDGIIKEQGQKIADMLKKEEDNPVTLKSIVAGQIENVKAALNSNVKRYELIIPTKTLVQTSGVADNTYGILEPGVGQLAYRGLVMRSLYRTKTIPAGWNGRVNYYDQVSVTRAAAAKAEGVVAPESAITWAMKNVNLCKIMDSIPVTYEALTDVDFMEQELKDFLMTNIAIKEDADLFSGDGNAPNIKGAYTYAGTFNAAASAFALSIYAPTIADVIGAMIIAMTASKESKVNPSIVIMNPSDAMQLPLTKKSDGEYIINPYADKDSIHGLRVVRSSAVTANTLLVADPSKAILWDEGFVRMEVGHAGDTFREDEYWMKAVKRALLMVRSVDEACFLKCTSISTAKTQLTAGS